MGLQANHWTEDLNKQKYSDSSEYDEGAFQINRETMKEIDAVWIKYYLFRR